MHNKKPIFLIILSFFCGYVFHALYSVDDFFPDPLLADYMGYDLGKRVFVFDVDRYGKEEIPFADLGITGVNAELYDTVFRLNKNRIMVTQFEKNKKWVFYLAKHGELQKLNTILLDLIGDQTLPENL